MLGHLEPPDDLEKEMKQIEADISSLEKQQKLACSCLDVNKGKVQWHENYKRLDSYINKTSETVLSLKELFELLSEVDSNPNTAGLVTKQEMNELNTIYSFIVNSNMESGVRLRLLSNHSHILDPNIVYHCNPLVLCSQ